MPTSPHPWVDLTAYPIVVITFPPLGAPSDVLAMTHALRRFAAALTEPIALMTDLSAVLSPDPEARQIYVQFVRDMRAITGKLMRGTAVIIKNPLQRTIFNLHSMLVGETSYPVRGFATRAEALPWLHARLGATA